LPLWSAFGSRFQSVVDIKGGDLDTGLQWLQTRPDEIAGPKVSFRFLTGLAELAEALSHAGRIAEALALVEAGIQQSEGGWLTPELLRLKGELLLVQRSTGALKPRRTSSGRRWTGRAAKRHCLGSCAPRRASPALLRDQGRSANAIACLQPIYDRFTEGFGTADLIAAKQLLGELGDTGGH
jgi:hypothetical protein